MNVAFEFGISNEGLRSVESVYDSLSDVDKENCELDLDVGWLEWNEINPKRLHCCVDIVKRIVTEQKHLGVIIFDEIQLIKADGLVIEDHYTNYLKQHKITLTVTHYVGYEIGTKNLV